MVSPHKVRYLQSMAEELHSQATRVRDLIGDVHWLSDGFHKEQLLRGLVERYLPAGFVAARGFVVAPTDDSLCSKEQDILVVDCTREPPLFNEGGLVITFPRDVVAAISVKTAMGKKEVTDSVEGLNSVRAVAIASGASQAIWCASYHFELGQTVGANRSLPYSYCDEAMRAHTLSLQGAVLGRNPHLGPDFICSAKELAFKISYPHEPTPTTFRIRGFECGTLATSLFMANLLDHFATHRGVVDSDFGRFVDSPTIVPLAKPDHVADLGIMPE